MAETKIPDDSRTPDRFRDILPSNSKLQPPTQDPPKREKRPEHLEKVTKGATVEKKPSIAKRILGHFVSDDIEEVKRYLKDDLIIPSIKSGILSALEMVFFHRTGGYGYFRPIDYSKASNQRPTTYTYSSRQNRGYVDAGQVKMSNGGLKTILYKTRMDAQTVLRTLDEQIDIYGEATVMQYYDASDIDSQFTDAKWGWKDLSMAMICPTSGGFIINMPRPILLD